MASALRDLVTSAEVCGPADAGGPSNAAASFANAILGGRAKQQQQVHELPGVGRVGPSYAPAPYRPLSAAAAAEAALRSDLPAVPGFLPHYDATTDVEAFLRQSNAAGDAFAREFEAAQSSGRFAGLPHDALSASFQQRAAVTPLLHAFLKVPGQPGYAAAPSGPLSLAVELSVPDKCRVRDRSTILARQMFADQGAGYADAQVDRLLHSLNIDPAALPGGGALAASPSAWDAIYKGASHAASHAASAAAARPSTAWINEFQALQVGENGPSAAAVQLAWANEFAATEGGASDWADEYRASAAVGTAARQRAGAGEALEQTKKLAETLSANQDPKFQNSKFLQFVSKMSRGELIMEDNAVREVPAAAARWAEEFSSQREAATSGVSLWGDEFAAFQAQQHPGTAWAEQFAAAEQPSTVDAAAWEEEYLQELERLHSEVGPRSSGQYVMTENNPFLIDYDSFVKGKDLFRKGVLSEAVLALEAECQRNPSNAEAWRLLGTVQAENDDDTQAIAALNRALAADPSHLDALLSLGVSHTNELEQTQALGYLREWIMRHPTHSLSARHAPGPPDSSQAMAYVVGLYEAAAAAAPQDADVHAALGVLYNLARRYDGAVNSFRAALALRPQDYSLWNKLGATLANSARSADALEAYEKALDLKPNYMRAWTNMGISLANLGDYDGSARYYVRALALNRKAAAVWGYLRTSLSCAAREDLLRAADMQDLEALAEALPL